MHMPPDVHALACLFVIEYCTMFLLSDPVLEYWCVGFVIHIVGTESFDYFFYHSIFVSVLSPLCPVESPFVFFLSPP